jgi:hypothetical protein
VQIIGLAAGVKWDPGSIFLGRKTGENVVERSTAQDDTSTEGSAF